jgi:glyoxylase-like metal-dependent hydrolase (beta-lactamase superfamily II)
MLHISTFVLGPLQNNVYLLEELETRRAVIVDPAYDSRRLLPILKEKHLDLQAIWLTHAHFDHFAGIAELIPQHPAAESPHRIPIGLHPADLPVWQSRGGADSFGFFIPPLPTPDLDFFDGQKLTIGPAVVEVRHVPGHSPGHVVFYLPDNKAVVCGDVVFRGSIGRTDLPGGDFQTLLNHIRSQVLSLPDVTRLLPGHGPATTIGAERMQNPFLSTWRTRSNASRE